MHDVYVVDICTPPYLHSDHILQVIDADKYVVCDKAAGEFAPRWMS